MPSTGGNKNMLRGTFSGRRIPRLPERKRSMDWSERLKREKGWTFAPIPAHRPWFARLRDRIFGRADRDDFGGSAR
jgi:hypothetical protein